MKEGDPLALRCVAALASSTTQSVARHRPTASSASNNSRTTRALGEGGEQRTSAYDSETHREINSDREIISGEGATHTHTLVDGDLLDFLNNTNPGTYANSS